MIFMTSYGKLIVDGDQLILEQPKETIRCLKHTDVLNKNEAEQIAKAMHNIGGRFSFDWRMEYGK